MSLLNVENLEVTYKGKGRKKDFKALKGVSLDIRPGECVGLVGESGSGKTTLGRAVLGLAPVTGGSIKLNGHEISHASRDERRDLARDIQVVFQDPYSSLNPSMSIEQILAEPLMVRDWTKEAASKRVRELLEAVNLPADAADRCPREFSGGQRQRIAIARAMILRPKLVVLDEPNANLDDEGENALVRAVQGLKAKGKTVVLISHRPGIVGVADRLLILHQGTVQASGPRDGVLAALQQQREAAQAAQS